MGDDKGLVSREAAADLLEEFRDYASREITRGGAHHDQNNIWARVAQMISELRALPSDAGQCEVERMREALERIAASDGLPQLIAKCALLPPRSTLNPKGDDEVDGWQDIETAPPSRSLTNE